MTSTPSSQSASTPSNAEKNGYFILTSRNPRFTRSLHIIKSVERDSQKGKTVTSVCGISQLNFFNLYDLKGDVPMRDVAGSRIADCERCKEFDH